MGTPNLIASEIRDALLVIRNDNKSGASTLFQQTLNQFPAIASDLNGHRQDFQLYLQQLAELICSLQPSMAPFIQLANYLHQVIEKQFELEVVRAAFAAMPHAFGRKLRKEQDKIIRQTCEVLADCRRILVHSRSALIEQFLRKWLAENREREVWITESRPMCEGRDLAAALSYLPNEVVLLVDDARGLAIEFVDVALIGADRISETSVVNKIGSRSLALLASAAQKPVYVMAELIKFLPARFELKPENPHDGREVDRKIKNVELFNYYFEAVPSSLFQGMITVAGIIPPGQLASFFQSEQWNVFAIEEATT